MLTTAAVVLFVVILAAGAAIAVVSKLVHICQPNEVLVFSGTRRREGGRAAGYRLVQVPLSGPGA